MAKYKARKRAGFQNSVDQALESARRQVIRSKYAFIISYPDTETGPDTRLVEPIFDESNFTFWVGTGPTSRKVRQVRANPQVTLAFSNIKDDSNLIVKARASIVEDIEIRTKYWKSYWRLFFPDGPKGNDYVLISLRLRN